MLALKNHRVFMRCLAPLFFIMLSLPVFALDSFQGDRGQGKTAAEAYSNCAGASYSSTVIENGSCDYTNHLYSTGNPCSNYTTPTYPNWRCATATLNCNVGGKTLYRSECVISTTASCTSGQWFNNQTGRCNAVPSCNTSTQWYNVATNQCNDKASCIGDQIYDSGTNTCQDPTCESPLFYNESTGLCAYDPVCYPPQDLDTSTHECVNYDECVMPLAYDFETDSCVTTDDCAATPLQGDTVQANGACGCNADQIQVIHGTVASNTVACETKQDCTPESSGYMYTHNGVHVCDPDQYCGAGETGGIVQGQLICTSDNPCDYETLALVGSGGCSNPQSDLDGDGNLDGGDEGVTSDSPGVAPDDLPEGTETTGTDSEGVTADYSAITNRQDQQTKQLTKSLAEQVKTNEKLDTIANLTSKTNDALLALSVDAPDIPSNTYSDISENSFESVFNSVESDIAGTTSSPIPSATGLQDTINTVVGIGSNSSNCNLIELPIKNYGSIEFKCEKYEPIRNMLGYVFYVYTLFVLFQIVTRRPA